MTSPPQSDGKTPQRQYAVWILVALLVVCVSLRVIVLNKFLSDLSDDRDAYLSIARSVWNGDGIATFGSGSPTAFRPPLYPILIAPISQPSQQWQRGLFNILCGVGTLCVVWLTGRNLSLSLLSRTVAGLIICIDPLLLRYSAFPMTESVCTFLTALLLYRLTLPNGSAQGAFLTGVVFGLAVLCRPTIWAVGGLTVLMYVAYRIWRKDIKAPTWNVKAFILCACGIAVVISPWVIRKLFAFWETNRDDDPRWVHDFTRKQLRIL